MKEYVVRIKETLQMEVTISAKSMGEAKYIAERRWKDGDYILDSDHFQKVDFAVPTHHEHER
ncbi:DpnD/PcfM family protein [Clostridiaceae bacterium OttesenSCG-928-D20]|nr:DpnD/PcfM family protein [Clostridiaceae bacterium OttesenSCG-928-D20]